MPIIIVFDEAAQHELGRGDSNQNLGQRPLTITHFNGGPVQVNDELALADALNPANKKGYMVTNVVNQYQFTLE